MTNRLETHLRLELRYVFYIYFVCFTNYYNTCTECDTTTRPPTPGMMNDEQARDVYTS